MPASPEPLPSTTPHLIFHLIRALMIAIGANLAVGLLVFLTSPGAHAAGGGTLLLRGADGEVAAPTLNTEVDIRVAGPLARARVAQVFHNDGENWQEGRYVFPLPENAAVDRLHIRVGDRVIEGEIQPREQAAQTYAAARAAGQRTALVEQERPNIFTTSVANIGPGESIRVEIEYQQTLAYTRSGEHGRYSLRFPMVVAPRYIPGEPAPLKVARPQRGWARDGDEAADAARITPPVRHPDDGPINPVALRVEIEAGVAIGSVRSAFHPVNVERPGPSRRIATLADGPVPADRDFELEWTLAPGNAPSATLFVEPGAGQDHALVMVVPPSFTTDHAPLAREVIFIIDTSGSMHGTSIEQAREALALAISRLSPSDRFNIIAFASSARSLFDSPRDADDDATRRALAWVARLEADGGTEMAGALALALDGANHPERVRQIVFLTDGAVGNESALFAQIAQGLGDSRLFTVGIGSAPNSHFMRKAAQSGRGTFTYIGSVDEVGERMGELFAKLASPVLKGVEVRWETPQPADAGAHALPDLYLGEPVLLAAALAEARGSVVVSARAGAIRWESRIELAEANEADGIAALWARQRIDTLIDRLQDGADEDQIRADVTALALAHHLVSRYTSLVAVDRTPARPDGAPLDASAIPTNLPAGWNHAAVFGELPRGATPARMNLLLGTTLLLLGLALRFLGRRGPARFLGA